jgi:hypothetical protein
MTWIKLTKRNMSGSAWAPENCGEVFCCKHSNELQWYIGSDNSWSEVASKVHDRRITIPLLTLLEQRLESGVFDDLEVFFETPYDSTTHANHKRRIIDFRVTPVIPVKRIYNPADYENLEIFGEF